MTNARIIGAIWVLIALFSATAEARVYTWVDDKGQTHSGDVIPPEYANKDKVQFNEKGREVKKKESKESAGEAGAVNKNAEEKQAVIDQRRRDNALVNTYSNEKEIELARDRNLQQVEARINGIQVMLKPAQKDLDNYLKEADGLKQSGKKIPDSLQSDITNAENKVAKLKQDLAKAQEKDASVRASFEADKVRFRELTGGAKK